MPLTELLRHVIKEVENSFVYGYFTSMTSPSSNNIIMKHVKSIRKAGENAKYALLFNLMMYAMTKLNVKISYGSIISIFITSLIIGSRNGCNFAVKNGMYGVMYTVAKRTFLGEK